MTALSILWRHDNLDNLLRRDYNACKSYIKQQFHADAQVRMMMLVAITSNVRKRGRHSVSLPPCTCAATVMLGYP